MPNSTPRVSGSSKSCSSLTACCAGAANALQTLHSTSAATRPGTRTRGRSLPSRCTSTAHRSATRRLASRSPTRLCRSTSGLRSCQRPVLRAHDNGGSIDAGCCCSCTLVASKSEVSGACCSTRRIPLGGSATASRVDGLVEQHAQRADGGVGTPLLDAQRVTALERVVEHPDGAAQRRAQVVGHIGHERPARRSLEHADARRSVRGPGPDPGPARAA